MPLNGDSSEYLLLVSWIREVLLEIYIFCNNATTSCINKFSEYCWLVPQLFVFYSYSAE